MINGRVLTAVMIVATAVLARAGWGQVQVTAGVSSDRVYVGDGLRLDVQVAGSKSPDRPVVPSVPGVLIEFAGGQDTSRRSIMIVNGRRTEDTFEGYVFSYRVLPTKAGRFVVPPISVTVDGQVYTSNPVAFTAVEAGEAPGFKLVLEAEKTKVYVGEPVRVKMTWYLSETARGGTFTMPPTDGAFELLAAPAPAGAQGNEFTLFGKPAVAVQGESMVDGERWETISVERVFVARRAGDVTLGPIRLAFDVDISRGIFGRSERKVVSSNTITFDVEALPLPQPSGFSGLVGEYRVGTRASATEVHVGDPITLTVAVLGPEPLEAVPPMDMTRQPGFGAFKLSSEPMLPSIVTGNSGERAAVFSTTIRAESDDITEIPAIELAYFDVATGKYGVARSDAIPLKVLPTTEVGLPSDPADAAVAAQRESERVGGLSPLVKSVDVLTQGSFDLATTVRSPLVVGVLGGPALLYLGSVGVVALRRRSERDPARRRRRAAQARAVRRLSRSGGDAQKIGAALRGYVADWFDVPEAGVTSAECAERVRAAGAGSAGDYETLLERCDAALFGGAGAVVTQQEATEVVRRLARELDEVAA